MKFLAKTISIVFHPIFMASYMLLILMWVNPYLFGVHHWSERLDLLVLLAPTSAIIPIICILLMKPLGFVNSFQLKTRQERTIPYVSTAILYLWLFINLLNQKFFPTAYTIFFFGILIALFLSFFINIFSKISAHCVGAGGLIGMLILTWSYYSYGSVSVNLGMLGLYSFDFVYLLLASILLAGTIGSARLILNAHEKMDIYGGYIVGFSSMLISFQILNQYAT